MQSEKNIAKIESKIQNKLNISIVIMLMDVLKFGSVHFTSIEIRVKCNSFIRILQVIFNSLSAQYIAAVLLVFSVHNYIENTFYI